MLLPFSLKQLTMNESLLNFSEPELEASGSYEDHIKKYSFKSNNVIELLRELKIKFPNFKAKTPETC